MSTRALNGRRCASGQRRPRRRRCASDPARPSDFAPAYAGLADIAGAQDAARHGQRSLMEEAVGTKPNDQLAIKQLFQTGNTPGYTAPGVTPGNPDLSGCHAQEIAEAHWQAPVARMQELPNANDAFTDAFKGVLQNSTKARRQALEKALEDAEWHPRDLMKEGHGDDTLLGLGRTVLAKGVNTVGRAFQNAPSNAARDADLARIGTLTGPDRQATMAEMLNALPGPSGQGGGSGGRSEPGAGAIDDTPIGTAKQVARIKRTKIERKS